MQILRFVDVIIGMVEVRPPKIQNGLLGHFSKLALINLSAKFWLFCRPHFECVKHD